MSTLAHKLDTLQEHQDGDYKVSKDSLVSYVKKLINDNASYRDGTFHLNVSELPHEDKVIFLSRLVSAEDYEFYMQSQFMLRVAIKDNEWFMQTIVNCHIPQAWTQVQAEIDDWKRGRFYGTDSYAEQIETLPHEPSGITNAWRIN